MSDVISLLDAAVRRSADVSTHCFDQALPLSTPPRPTSADAVDDESGKLHSQPACGERKRGRDSPISPVVDEDDGKEVEAYDWEAETAWYGSKPDLCLVCKEMYKNPAEQLCHYCKF